MRQFRRAAVLLHVETEQPVTVVEQAVAVGIAVNRRVRHAVAVICGRGVVEHGGVREGDRGVDGIAAVGRKRNHLKVAQRRDLIGGRTAVERTRLVLGVADTRAIRVRQHVIVGQDVHVPERITHARANRAGGDRRVPGREAHGGGPLALRRIAERHQAAADPHGDRHAIERLRQPGETRALCQDQDAGAAVRHGRDRGADDAGHIEQRRRVTPHRGDRAEHADDGAGGVGGRNCGTGGRTRPGVGACVPHRGSGNQHDYCSGANQLAADHSNPP